VRGTSEDWPVTCNDCNELQCLQWLHSGYTIWWLQYNDNNTMTATWIQRLVQYNDYNSNDNNTMTTIQWLKYNDNNGRLQWATMPTISWYNELQCPMATMNALDNMMTTLQWQQYNDCNTAIQWLQYNDCNTMTTIQWLQWDGTMRYNAYNAWVQWEFPAVKAGLAL
jgi:hypothetical protein